MNRCGCARVNNEDVVVVEIESRWFARDHRCVGLREVLIRQRVDVPNIDFGVCKSKKNAQHVGVESKTSINNLLAQYLKLPRLLHWGSLSRRLTSRAARVGYLGS